MLWRIVVVEPALSWLRELRKTDRSTSKQIGAALEVLSEEGPSLGRPLVDTIKGSRLSHLKEIRPGSSGGTEVRLLFVFDPERNAVILVAGDKTGKWTSWYSEAIKRAEEAYDVYNLGRGGRG